MRLATCLIALAMLLGCESESRTCPPHDCMSEGLCTSANDGCVAKTDKECAQSWACIDEGRCWSIEGWCGYLEVGK